MAGAYVSLPPLPYVYDIPPGWNYQWPFLIPPPVDQPLTDAVVGPSPPGYDPVYTLTMSAT